jgi:hypothetical protein
MPWHKKCSMMGVSKLKPWSVNGMKRISSFVVIAAALFSATTAKAAGQTALDQLFAEAGVTGAPVGMQIASPTPACLSVAGKWTACPASGNWNVPKDMRSYLAAISTSAIPGTGGVPRRIMSLTAYYTLEFSMKEEVLKYYGNAGPKEAALAEFAGRQDTRVLGDGKRVYFVSGGKVIEVKDVGLAAATGKVMSGVSVGRLDAAVGCAMNAACWNGLGTALDEYADWLAANEGKKEEKKDKEKKEDAPANEG